MATGYVWRRRELIAAGTAGDVIVIEDVHWVDEASRALADVLSRSARSATAHRDHPASGRTAAACDATIDLQPITDGDAERLLLGELPTTSPATPRSSGSSARPPATRCT